MIELPETDGENTRRAMAAVNQRLVDKGDYRLVLAFLNQGKTVRFRITCDEIQGAVCPMCIYGTAQDRSNLLDYLQNYLDDRIDPSAPVWALGLTCIPTRGQMEVVLKPIWG